VIGPGSSTGAGARVLIATRPVDFRKGADSLAALVTAAFGADPFSGVVYVFRAKKPHPTSFSIPFAIYCRGISLAPASRRARSGLRAARPGRPPDSVYRGATWPLARIAGVDGRCCGLRGDLDWFRQSRDRTPERIGL
jgi:hypothetical protein